MQEYRVEFQLGTASTTSQMQSVVRAMSPSQAQALVESQYPGAWVKSVQPN